MIWSDDLKRIVPENFVKIIFRYFQQFEPHTQQDAQEFLMAFLDKIDSEISQFDQNFKLLNLFKGDYKYVNRCLNCNLSSENIDSFTQLSISIPNEGGIDPWLSNQLSEEEQKILNKAQMGLWNIVKSVKGNKQDINIYHCLRGFVEQQTIEKFCDRCCTLTSHTTRIKMESLPDYLIISLKRFRYSYWSSKISDQVYLTETLHFSKIQQKEEEYKLAAVIEHGGFVIRGHYKIYLKQKDDWWLLNDKKVRKSSFEEVFNAQAYILMYIKSSVLQEISNSGNKEEESKQPETIPIQKKPQEPDSNSNWFNLFKYL